MRFYLKTFLVLLIGAGLVQAARADDILEGFFAQGDSSKPVLIDPEFADVVPDQDNSAGSYYGVALHDFQKRIASFTPQGSNEFEIKDSRDKADRGLREMILKAKAANKDSKSSVKSYLLFLEGTVQLVDVNQNDPKAVEKVLKERQAELAQRKYEASDEYKERMALKQEIWNESKRPGGKSVH
jgi:cysteinyl-tRNA synthetase